MNRLQNTSIENLEYLDNIDEAMSLLIENDTRNMENDAIQIKNLITRDSLIKQQEYRESSIGYREKLRRQMQDMLEAMKVNFDLNRIEPEYIALFAQNAGLNQKLIGIENELRAKSDIMFGLERELKNLQSNVSKQITELNTEKSTCSKHVANFKTNIRDTDKKWKTELKELVVDGRKTAEVGQMFWLKTVNKLKDFNATYFSIQSY